MNPSPFRDDTIRASINNLGFAKQRLTCLGLEKYVTAQMHYSLVAPAA
jgi:hypothetical protein